ncbi:KamA family radical SAM protein [candidate division LCP-89 bacterium B3_LCP]|uniref:KamA family radical SAM protein n=1 Tax=candidate division LCP-89 bacterium B3_LCP TaxID=2012998 RepID=A0A532V4Y3_UNCL8|nr:MAG: KamA family radical SAM protein [candidate division LCP-89 bacterium B3_LCP]
MLAEKEKARQDEKGDDRRLLLDMLWTYNRAISEILEESKSDGQARNELYSYFWLLERSYDLKEDTIHSLEWDLGRECLRVVKNLISRRSQRLTGFNLVGLLRKLAKPRQCNKALKEISPGFLIELERLFAGCRARSGIYYDQQPSYFQEMEGREASEVRSYELDHMAEWMHEGISRYPTGFDASVIKTRQRNKRRILKALGGDENNWNDWHWQLRHVVRDVDDLTRLVGLSHQEVQAVKGAVKNRLPFGITPYYVHLMAPDPGEVSDRAIRYQVIPPMEYVERMSAGKRKQDSSFDFMQERDTSPVDLITRRYPMICILKPYNSCAQICVYCQRNWEIETCLDPNALASNDELEKAIRYIAETQTLKEVLVTGGDPLIMGDKRLKCILDRLAEIPHVELIRIGSRTPVVLPMRITDELADMLASYRKSGRREMCIMTHFEHASEVSPESAEAVERLRMRGMNVYNQVVFTFANSRRFEMSALRRALRMIGVESYYTFTPKGKEETDWYRVPLARLLQERTEEARLTPGTWRTDDTIFNVPRLGKNYLNRRQDHEFISILPDGKRVYEFHPWEKKLALVDSYLHTDMSIHEYLQRIEEIGEDPDKYSTIWYYF